MREESFNRDRGSGRFAAKQGSEQRGTLTEDPVPGQQCSEPTRIVERDGGVVYRNSRGKLHRIDGPAVTLPSGREQWWLHGVPYSESEFAGRMQGL